MKSDLEILKEIQSWDRKVYELLDKLDSIPEELSDIQLEVEKERESFNRTHEQLKAAQLKQKEKEVELNAKEENIKKYEVQLTQVKTNKEYSALQGEIKSLRADNSLLEEAIINLIDDVEALEKKSREQKVRLDEKEKLLKEKEKELQEEAKGFQNEIQNLRVQKREKIKGVNPEIASLYEQIVVKRHGLALVKVSGEACPACQMQLRPQVINEIQLKESIVVCENCSRILYCD